MDETLKELDRQIEEAKQAAAEVQAWQKTTTKAQNLNSLIGRRNLLIEAQERRAKFLALGESLRPVLAEAAERNDAWRARFISLCQAIVRASEENEKASGTKHKAVDDACTEADRHIATLEDIHAPVLKAFADLVEHSQGFQKSEIYSVFYEVGGNDPRLSLQFGDEVPADLRRQLSTRLTGMRVYHKPM
jgi:hypothetical protein